MALFVPNKNFAAEAADDPEQRAGLVEVAQPAATAARAIAHDIMPARVPVQIEVVETGDGVFLVNHAHGAAIDEYGSANNPPYAPLRRGAMAAGLRLEEAPQ